MLQHVRWSWDRRRTRNNHNNHKIAMPSNRCNLLTVTAVILLGIVLLSFNGNVSAQEQPQSRQLLNQPPHFVAGSGDMARFSLSENTPVGSPVYQLKGVDPEGSHLKYSISGPVFSVDRETGVVRLRQELDRETLDTIEVIISLTDEGIYGTEPNTISLRREIPVRDYNDNQPIFLGRPYATNVSEALPVGSVLEIKPMIIVIDRDDGINAELQIKCFHENDICDTFDVRSERISDGNYTARVTLKKPLDFESRPSYIMTVAASDGALENRLSSFASVTINVIDVQDQLPIFTNAPYSATVAENTPAGVSLLTIKAIDGDVGIPRDIYLSLEDEPYGHFQLEPFGEAKDGTAILRTTNIPLDREHPEILQNGGVYVFTIRATEFIDGEIPAEYATTQVTIVITDVDDHDPEFNESFFNVSVPENLENGMPLPGLAAFADDRDTGDNSRFQLSLRAAVDHAEGVFGLTPTEGQGRTPLVVRVLKSQALDYDVPDEALRRFEFDLIASVDGKMKASSRVQVNLVDTNDNSPVFNEAAYSFTIPEDIELNGLIGSVSATDKDSGEFGMVTYVLKGFGAENFQVDPEIGAILVHQPLDYEKQSSYSLTMAAVDGGGRETNVNVHIEVTDVNDNFPQFESSEYTRTIREGAAVFEPQFFVRAHDLDGPTQGGGKVRYAIESENSIAGNVFHIDDATGELTLQKVARSMDTEKGEYELVVSATDLGIPSLKNTTRIFIRVGISGNQRPIFRGHFQSAENVPIVGPPSYRVSIPENAGAGYNVTTVVAHDPDGLDDLLRYRIVGANDNFQIGEKTGLIVVSPQARIDRDANMDSFEIIVNAVDAGVPIPETATTTVYVNIKDINDEPPKFEQTSYAAYVSERTDIGESVLKVHATDKDLNSKLRYSIDRIQQATTKAGVTIANTTAGYIQAKKAFRIDPESGEIFINGSLRHDQAAVIVLRVIVRDLNAEVNPENQTDSTDITIYVQSFRDTNPVFKNNGWTSSRPIVFMVVQEEMPIESAIFILQAEDPVSNQSIIKFELVEPEELEYFHVHERTGEVILKKRLDYEAMDADRTQIIFQVKAISPDGERSTITKVNVSVENVNDNSPIFEKDSYHSTIIENKMHPEQVITVKATDKDAAFTSRDERLGYHRVIYSLQGEYASLFEINNITGEIRVAVNQTIDRERTPIIHLQVKAEDSPGQPTEAKQSIVDLEIEVLDVNDNAPEFSQTSYTAVVPENAPIDTFVLKLIATDPDEGPGGDVRYELVNEEEVRGLFKLNPTTGDIKTSKKLTGKGRANPYRLVARAQDQGAQVQKQESLYADVTLSIFIGDVSANDGIPFFISPEVGQMANITENAPAGSPVFKVIASDPDDPSTPSGRLYYNILDDSPDAEAFEIDEISGLITIVQPLDRETKEVYNIILEVFDDGQPQQSATRILQIQVLDVDDHEPLFAREADDAPLEFSVLEGEPEGTFVGNFTAIDEDINENAAIDYIIIDGNSGDLFTIERTNDSMAILRSTKSFDRESTESFTLTIKCLKRNTDNSSFFGDEYNINDLSMLRIKVRILDVDDNLPVFDHKEASIGIRITVPIETTVTTVHVTDRDAEASSILLSIENVTFVPQFYKRTRKLETRQVNNLFTLHNRTGELRTGGSFADFVDGYFQLKIRANNSANMKRHTFGYLKIFVIRDKSLLKFVFARPPGEIQSILRPFQQKLQQHLRPRGLELHILDTQVLTRNDLSIDYSATSSCFLMFKDGTAISLAEMQKIMESEQLKQDLLETYVEYDVSAVESCSVRKSFAAASLMHAPGTWLVILAALIGLGAILATCTACCLKRKYKKHTKRSMQDSRPAMEPYGMGVGVPTVFYSEPIYGPL